MDLALAASRLVEVRSADVIEMKVLGHLASEEVDWSDAFLRWASRTAPT